MKILSAEYFPIAPTVDTDSLTLITSILVNRQLRDRFDVLNKYSNVRWASGSDPVPTPIATPMVDLLDEHATSVIQQYDGDVSKPMVVLWSGGVDSTTIICALLKNGAKNVKVLCSKDSIEEYPWFFENVVKKLPYTVSATVPTDMRTIPASAIVTGWCADQLFGSNVHLRNLGTYNCSVQEGVLWHWKRSHPGGVLAQSALDTVDARINELGTKLGVKIEQFCEFAWLVNFAIKWTLVRDGLKFDLFGSVNQGKGIAFFDHQPFCNWAIGRFDGLRERNVNKEVRYYKRAFKEYIYDYTKDADYLQKKGKENSWGRNVKPPVRDKLLIITDEGWKRYRSTNGTSFHNLAITVGNLFRKNPLV